MDVAYDGDIPIGIKEFYKGRSVFITGFTGCIGKLLIEKILYSCPQVDKIYALVRTKKGQTPQQRVEDVIGSRAFIRIRDKYPGLLESKIIAVAGDVVSDKLGISDEDEELLKRDVSVVFHGAASVRFDDPLDLALRQNTVGAKLMVELAMKLPKLAVFLYISTAYSNCDHLYIKEELYPPKADWRETMKISEKIDPSTLQILTRKYIHTMPNTYVFTKSLSEQIINEYRNKLPIVIVRPSIVVPAIKEPMPGWTDNKYGPIALVLGFLFGIVRCSWVDVRQKCNYIPSDICVNSIIIVSWKTALKYNPKVKTDSVMVYNACSKLDFNTDHEEFSVIYLKGKTYQHLLNKNFHFVCLMFARNEWWYRVNILLRQWLPAAVIDLFLRIINRKPLMVSIRRKVFIATKALSYFTMRTFKFEDSNFSNLCNELRPEDREDFSWNFDKLDISELYENAFFQLQSTLLKPLYDDFETNRKRLQLLYYVDRGAVYLTYFLLTYFIYATSIPQAIYSFLVGLIYF